VFSVETSSFCYLVGKNKKTKALEARNGDFL